jgi:hypothetical protein
MQNGIKQRNEGLSAAIGQWVPKIGRETHINILVKSGGRRSSEKSDEVKLE